jgi:hypothetical protein
MRYPPNYFFFAASADFFASAEKQRHQQHSHSRSKYQSKHTSSLLLPHLRSDLLLLALHLTSRHSIGRLLHIENTHQRPSIREIVICASFQTSTYLSSLLLLSGFTSLVALIASSHFERALSVRDSLLVLWREAGLAGLRIGKLYS